jgi:hypothetical protein
MQAYSIYASVTPPPPVPDYKPPAPPPSDLWPPGIDDPPVPGQQVPVREPTLPPPETTQIH